MTENEVFDGIGEEVDGFDAVVLGGRRKGRWRVLLGAEALTLVSPDGSERYEISRAEAAEKIELLDGMLAPKWTFLAHIPKRQGFQAEREKIELLREWLGPPTVRELKVALRRRFKLCLPIGILFVLTSLPMRGDAEAGLEAVPLDTLGVVLGAVLIGLGLLMKVWPCRELFLVDSLWFAVLAGKLVYDMMMGAHWLWGIGVLLLVGSVAGGIRRYRRFEGLGRADDARAMLYGEGE